MKIEHVEVCDEDCTETASDNHNIESVDIDTDESAGSEHVSVDVLLSGLKEHFELFLLKLQEKHAVTRVVQQTVCDEVKYLIREFTSCYAEVIRFHIDKTYNIEQNDDLKELLQDDNIFVRAIEEMVADRAFC